MIVTSRGAAIASQIDLPFPADPGLDFSRASWDPIGVLVTVGQCRRRRSVTLYSAGRFADARFAANGFRRSSVRVGLVCEIDNAVLSEEHGHEASSQELLRAAYIAAVTTML